MKFSRLGVIAVSRVAVFVAWVPKLRADSLTFQFTYPDNDNTASQNSDNAAAFGGIFGCNTPGNTHNCWLGHRTLEFADWMVAYDRPCAGRSLRGVSEYWKGPSVTNGSLANTLASLTFFVGNSNGSAMTSVNDLVNANRGAFTFAVHAYTQNGDGTFDSQVGTNTPGATVPEPSTWLLLATGLAGLLWFGTGLRPRRIAPGYGAGGAARRMASKNRMMPSATRGRPIAAKAIKASG